MSALTQTILSIHIASGFTALTTGFFSMLNRKGGKNHRLTGKIFFGAMTGVFITAVVLSILKPNPFLFLVGFFSYYLACSGYRALYLKTHDLNKKPAAIDWIIGVAGMLAGIALLVFSLYWFQSRGYWGLVPLTFGSFCLTTALNDFRNIYGAENKQHRLMSHGSRMGGAFAATVTAFIVVNFTLGAYTWVLWILPGVLIGIWISKNLQVLKKGLNKTSNLVTSKNHEQ